MTGTPSRDVVRSPGWLLGVAAVVAGIAFAFSGALAQLAHLWTHKADYSHGLLMLPFAGYVLWTRRDLFPAAVRWPDLRGLPFYAAAAVIYVAADRLNVAKEWLQGFAVVVALAGVVVMFCGRWAGLRWAWPALAVLPLVLELPYTAEQKLSLGLRKLATEAGSATFLTAGLPSYTEGNVIVVGGTRLGVEDACSGLSMLLTFVAVAAAVAVLSRSRPAADRLAVVASAVPIAVLCNVVRIVTTGLVYHAGWKELGDLVVHDLFGWLMMPLALGLIWVELRLIDWVLVPVAPVTQEDLFRALRPGPIPVGSGSRQ